MSGAAWKDLERRVCRALGAERRPSIGAKGWARGSDDDGSAPFAVEVKRTTRLSLRAAWVTQARRNAKAAGKPWLLVIGTHGSPRPVAVLDFYALVQLAQEAGRLGEVPIDPEGDGMSEQTPDVGPQETPEPPTEPPAEAPTHIPGADERDEPDEDERQERVEKVE